MCPDGPGKLSQTLWKKLGKLQMGVGGTGSPDLGVGTVVPTGHSVLARRTNL